MNLGAVMDALATQLDTIDGVRVFGYVPDTVTVPVAIVAPPTVYNYDATMLRGGDRMTIPIYVLVGKVHDRSARDLLAVYVDGSGVKSFKAVLEAGTYTAFGSLRVQGVEIAPFIFNAVEYLGAMFSVDVAGPGA
jgi:hypothetical protein